MPKYTLIYFNGRGRAETIRFMFHVAGVKYTDKRINMEKDWPELKPTMPFGKLPVLEIDGRKLAESGSIARFLAKEHGLSGKNSLESSTIDSIAEVITDMREKIIAVATEKDEEKKEELMKDFKEKVIPPFLESMEKFVSNNKNKGEKGFIVSDKISWADLHLMYVCDILASKFEPQEGEEEEDMFETAPKVKALLERINEDEKVKEWKTKRPETSF